PHCFPSPYYGGELSKDWQRCANCDQLHSPDADRPCGSAAAGVVAAARARVAGACALHHASALVARRAELEVGSHLGRDDRWGVGESRGGASLLGGGGGGCGGERCGRGFPPPLRPGGAVCGFGFPFGPAVALAVRV